MKLIESFVAAAVILLAGPLLSMQAPMRPSTAMGDGFVQIFNEDDSHFFLESSHASVVDLEGYVDKIAEGGAITHFFMCPNAQRANFYSAVLQSAWAVEDIPGWKSTKWSMTLKTLHDKGIDPYAVWIRRSRQRKISPWLSVRMNDVHSAYDMTYGGHSRFWRDHPQFWRKPCVERGGWCDRALDYAHAEVRAYMLAFIGELLERYDVDGMECDWMRFPEHLTPGRERELSPCLTAFMHKVRQLADAAAVRWGHAVRVGVRVDSDPDAALARGTDAFAWARDGSVDLVVPCNFFESVDFQLPYADWRARMDGVNPIVRIVPGLDSGVVLPGEKRRFLTIDEYCGWANRQYSQGARGIYLFNLFTHPLSSGVMQFVLKNGLGPEIVEAHAQSVPEGAMRECSRVLKR